MDQYKFNGDWIFDLKLPEFSKLHSYEEPPKNEHQKKLFNGYVPFQIWDERTYDPDPTPAQINTIEYLINNEKKVVEDLFHAFKNTINPFHAEACGDWDWIPPMNSPADLGKLMSIHNLQVLVEEKEGMAYYRMDCEYEGDPEHGLAVVMHKENLIDQAGIGDMGYEGIAKDEGYDLEKAKAKFKGRDEFGINMVHQPIEKYGKFKTWQIDETEEYFRNLLYQKKNEQIKNEIKASGWDINFRFPSLDINLVDVAAYANNPEMINWLIEQGADYSQSIKQCIGYLKKDAVECLVGHGVSVDYTDSRRTTTPLLNNILSFVQNYRYRIDYKQQGRMQQYERSTKAMVLHKDSVLFYLAMGANPSACNKEGHDYKTVLRKKYIPRILEKYNIIEEVEKLIEPGKQGGSMWKFWKKG